MPAQTKTAASALALIGAVLILAQVPAAMAETGPGGGDDRGARLMQIFTTADADADGKVTQEELAAQRAAQFAAADSNGDGALGSDELAARDLARFTKTVADRAARLLERHDANGDGSLSPDEIGEGPIEDHFARIDSDDDGAISKAEAEAASERLAEHRGKRKHGMKDGGFN